MRIALIAPPFISVPPQKYGGTELFVAVLADALHAKGHQVVVYANGDSRVNCELRWRYRRARWPIVDAAVAPLENLDHTVWALHDAAKSADEIEEEIWQHLQPMFQQIASGSVSIPNRRSAIGDP